MTAKMEVKCSTSLLEKRKRDSATLEQLDIVANPDGGMAGQQGEEPGSINEGDRDGVGEGTGFARAFLQILSKEGGVPGGDPPILVKQHRAVVAAAEAEKADLAEKQESKKQRKELVELAHVLPAPGPTPKERALLQVATRGVVRLFNAVAKAQKDEAAAAAAPDRSHNTKGGVRLDKRSFLAELRGVADGAWGTEQRVGSQGAGDGGAESEERMGPSGAAMEHSQAGPAEQGASHASWDIFRDDFMLGRQKLADWDRGTDEAPPASFDDSDDPDEDSSGVSEESDPGSDSNGDD